MLFSSLRTHLNAVSCLPLTLSILEDVRRLVEDEPNDEEEDDDEEEEGAHFNTQDTPLSLSNLSAANTSPSDNSLLPLMSNTLTTPRPAPTAPTRTDKPYEVKLFERTSKYVSVRVL